MKRKQGCFRFASHDKVISSTIFLKEVRDLPSGSALVEQVAHGGYKQNIRRIFMKNVQHALGAILVLAQLLGAEIAFAPPAGEARSLAAYEDHMAPLVLAGTTQIIISVGDVVRYADQLDFSDPKLIASIAMVESDVQPQAKSTYKGVTYYGLMQISYSTAKMVGFRGKPHDLMNWRTNIKWATKYLAQLKAEHGTLRKTIAAYNAGTVYYCQRKCPRGHLVNEDYVRKVLRAYEEINEESSSEVQVGKSDRV